MNLGRTLREYAAYFEGSRRTLVLALVVAVVQSAALLPIPWFAIRAFDVLIPRGDASGLLATGAAILALLLAQGGLALWARRLTLGVTKRATARIREDLLAKFCSLPRNILASADHSALHTRAVDDTERVDAMTNALVAMILPATLLSATLGLVLLVFSPRLFVLTLPFAPLVWITSRRIGVRLRQDVTSFRRIFEVFSRGMQFILHKRDFIEAQAAGEQERRTQSEVVDRLRQASERVAWGNGAYALIHAFLFGAAGTVVLSVGGIEVVRGGMTTGTLASYFVVLGLLRAQMGIVSANLPFVVGGRASLEAVLELLRLPSAAPPAPRSPLHFSGRIAVEDVTYGYDAALEPVLRGVSFELAPGEAVALVGRNGAGKTTLLNLILGFDVPWSGRLLADGLPYGSFEIVSLRRRIGSVLQDAHVARGTLVENVTYGTPDVGADELARAARLASLDSFLAVSPLGWATPVGDDGATLSAGLRQRVAIARAVLRRPALLLLDEPTAHLDAPTVETLLGKLRETLPATTLLVATHDRNLAGRCDRVLALEAGRVLDRSAAAVARR